MRGATRRRGVEPAAAAAGGYALPCQASREALLFGKSFLSGVFGSRDCMKQQLVVSLGWLHWGSLEPRRLRLNFSGDSRSVTGDR